VVIFSDVLDEGERDKIIQQNDTITPNTVQQASDEDMLPETTKTHPENSSEPSPKPCCSHNVLPEPEPNTGYGMHAWLSPGAYETLAEGTNDTAALTYTTAFTCDVELDDEDLEQGVVDRVNKMLMMGYLTHYMHSLDQ
jgi:hypothetical protein